MSKRPNVQKFKRPKDQMSKRSNVQKSKCPKGQKSWDQKSKEQRSKSPSVQKAKCQKGQMSRSSFVPKTKCPKVQVSKRPNVNETTCLETTGPEPQVYLPIKTVHPRNVNSWSNWFRKSIFLLLHNRFYITRFLVQTPF